MNQYDVHLVYIYNKSMPLTCVEHVCFIVCPFFLWPGSSFTKEPDLRTIDMSGCHARWLSLSPTPNHLLSSRTILIKIIHKHCVYCVLLTGSVCICCLCVRKHVCGYVSVCVGMCLCVCVHLWLFWSMFVRVSCVCVV